jgi:tripartite-type tricarboxylate transporter receptor subunit TctC
MKSNRWILTLGVATVAGSMLASSAQAQTFPSRPVRLMVGYAAGGPVDLGARMMAPGLQKQLGQPVLVENKPGASGTVAGDYVAKVAPDGYTLFFAASPTLTINPHVQKKMPFNVLTDFTPLTLLVDYANVLVVNKDVPAKTVAELVAYAKANPEKVSFGSAGIGGSNHLSAEMLKKATGAPMLHVPYKGNAPAMADVMGGKITYMFDIVSTARSFINDGRVRALAVTSKSRNHMLPNLPTMIEAGVPGYEVTGWYALVGPLQLPQAVSTRLITAARAALAEPDMKKQLVDAGYDVVSSTPQALQAKIKADYDLWARVSEGIKFED